MNILKLLKAGTIRKKVVSICLILSITFGFIGLPSISFAKYSDDIASKVIFVTDSTDEQEFIKELDVKISDDSFLKKNDVNKDSIKELREKIKIQEVKSIKDIQDPQVAEAVDAIYISNSSISNSSVVDYAKKQIESGKIIYFYGNDTNLEQFASLFGLEKNLPKEANVTANNKPKADERKSINPTQKFDFLGVQKEPWGYTLIQSQSLEYDFFNCVLKLQRDTLHAKKLSKEKSYEHPLRVNDLNTLSAAYADSLSGTPINHVRWYNILFPSSTKWGALSDIYLFKVDDADSTNDYLYIEVKSEMDETYNGTPAYETMGFYQKIDCAYSDDNYYDCSPKDQTSDDNGTVQIQCGIPLSVQVAYSYTTNDKVIVDSNFSQANTYVETYYTAHDNYFPDVTHHESMLSWSTYAPSSAYTYVDVDISFKAKSSYVGSNWQDSLGGTARYTFDY